MVDGRSSPTDNDTQKSLFALLPCRRVLMLMLVPLILVLINLRGSFLSIVSLDKTEYAIPDSDKKKKDFFSFSSGNEGYDAAYRLAMAELSENVQDGRFIAGAGWTQLWTRDTSYAVDLAAGLIFPRVSRVSLEACVEQDNATEKTVWLQDECGHFGGWPNLSDAIVGVQGAWSLYLVTGERDFLEWTYEITKSSLVRAEREVYDGNTGLFLGCSSFMESNSGYPKRYSQNGTLVAKTKALSTNMLHYMGYKLGAKMGRELHAPAEEIDQLNEKAQKLRDAIRSRLWLSEEGYYSYVEDEDNELFPQMEGLGESLALLAPDFETDPERIDSIFASTIRTKHGLPCLWPQFDHGVQKENTGFAQTYHNGRIWPFVQGYWAVAAARHGKLTVFEEELKHLVALSSLKGNGTFAEFYELDGSFAPSRSRQLWSDAGFLSMVFYGLFGMNLQTDGIKFGPIKPLLSLADTISLERVKYREMVLDIYVSGSGLVVQDFRLDGIKQDSPFVPNSLKGEHTVQINLK